MSCYTTKRRTPPVCTPRYAKLSYNPQARGIPTHAHIWEYKRNKKKGTGREKVVGIFLMAEMGKVQVAIKKITVVNIV